ncbi:MAG: hypothetical protein LBG69_03160 [Zoogloeaceae bacterium]|jgi:hypothetical protein|nr:hypothetical protein [Zoogloeaceae bacterium]
MRHHFIKTTAFMFCFVWMFFALCGCYQPITSGKTEAAVLRELHAMLEEERFKQRKSYIIGYMKMQKISGEPFIYNIATLEQLRPMSGATSLEPNAFYSSLAKDMKPFSVSSLPIAVHDDKAAEDIIKMIARRQKNLVITSSDPALSANSLEAALDSIEYQKEPFVIYLQSKFAFAPPPPKDNETAAEKMTREIQAQAFRNIFLQRGIGMKAAMKNITIIPIPHTE